MVTRLLLIFLVALPAFAGTPKFSELVSRDEFQKLAEDLSHKVNLFAEAWEKDDKAEFFGGTTRDYLNWLKGRFRGCKSRAQADDVITTLRARGIIDVKEFIIGESDVDVISEHYGLLAAADYGIRKIDTVDRERLDANTEKGKNEIDQGFIPMEKIRLAKKGFVKWKGMGDGVKELWLGKPSLSFAEKEQFESTYYAQKKLNHPVLLALRYLRLLAINYYQEEGAGAVDEKKLFDIDPEIEAKLRAIISDAAKSGTLAPYLKNEQFARWLNAGLQRALRSYTNPNAARRLFEHFGVDALASSYPDNIKP
jgi:hypothetical protein